MCGPSSNASWDAYGASLLRAAAAVSVCAAIVALAMPRFKRGFLLLYVACMLATWFVMHDAHPYTSRGRFMLTSSSHDVRIASAVIAQLSQDVAQHNVALPGASKNDGASPAATPQSGSPPPVNTLAGVRARLCTRAATGAAVRACSQPLVNSHTVNDVLRRIVHASAASPDVTSQATAFLIHDAEPSVAVLPGGVIVVTTGVSRWVASEDELAALLAHAFAHAVSRHSEEIDAITTLKEAPFMLLRRFVSFAAFSADALTWNVDVMLQRTYTRTQEEEAEYVAAHYLARLCYNASAPSALWQRALDLHQESQLRNASNGVPFAGSAQHFPALVLASALYSIDSPRPSSMTDGLRDVRDASCCEECSRNDEDVLQRAIESNAVLSPQFSAHAARLAGRGSREFAHEAMGVAVIMILAALIPLWRRRAEPRAGRLREVDIDPASAMAICEPDSPSNIKQTPSATPEAVSCKEIRGEARAPQPSWWLRHRAASKQL